MNVEDELASSSTHGTAVSGVTGPRGSAAYPRPMNVEDKLATPKKTPLEELCTQRGWASVVPNSHPNRKMRRRLILEAKRIARKVRKAEKRKVKDEAVDSDSERVTN